MTKGEHMRVYSDSVSSHKGRHEWRLQRNGEREIASIHTALLLTVEG